MNSNIRYLLLGRIGTNIADSLVFIVLTWYFAGIDTLLYLTLFNFIYNVINALHVFQGPIIDKCNINKLLVFSSLVQIVLVIGLIASIYFHLNVIVLLFFAASYFFSSLIEPTEDIVIGNIVEENELIKVNSIFQIAYKSLDLLANAAVAFLLIYFTYKDLLSISIVIFIIAAIFFKKLKQIKHTVAEDEKFNFAEYKEDLVEGFKFIKKKFILMLLIPLTVTNLFYAMNWTVVPKFIYETSNSPFGYGVIMITAALGSTLGYYVSNFLYKHISVRSILSTCLGVAGIAWSILFVYDNIYSLPVIIFFSSASIAVLNLFFITAFQKIPPKDMIGRVYTINMTIITIASPIGAILGGIVGTYLGIKFVFLTYGVILILTAAFYLLHSDFKYLKNKDSIEWDKISKQ